MKRIITSTFIIMALLFTGCKNNSNKQQAASNEVEEVEIVEVNEPIAEEPIFLMKTSMGNIKIKLYKETPLHRDNFVKLAKSGYYDGLLFHRVIDGFMIQGGDPLTRDASKADRYGTGGPNYTVPAEFVPEFKHKKGALAAARRGDSVNPEKASSGSQFYLVQDENSCAQLDGNYTVFGETLEGIDVIDAIAKVATNARDLPLEPVKIISVKEVKE